MMDMAAHHPVDAPHSASRATLSSKREMYSTAFLTLCFRKADSDQ